MLDSIAHRYGMLPSQVLQHATTQDVFVFDIANSYRIYQQEKQEKRNNKSASAEPQALTPELMERYEKFKNANKNR